MMSATSVFGFSFVSLPFSSFHIVMFVIHFFIIDLPHDFLASAQCISISYYCYCTWWPQIRMILLDWSHTVPHLRPYMALSHTCHLMILLRHRIFPVQHEQSRPLQLSIPSSSRSWAILCLPVRMNFGSWKGHWMVLKRGNPWKHFWRTCTLPMIRRPYVPRLIIGADTMTYQFNHHPPPLRQLLFLFYHTLNTPTSMSPSHTKRYRTNSIFCSHAGDALPNTTLKEPPPLYIGHLGGLHHLLHHRQHYNVRYISLALPSLLNKYRVHWMRTIWTRWICRTPVCNTPHHLSASEKNSDLPPFCDYLLGTPFPSNFLHFELYSLVIINLFCSLGFLLYTRHSIFDAMAHSSRPHPYRATSMIETPLGTRTIGWFAEHRGLPGDVNPPPNRPVLILVDFSPLQALTHRSEPDREHYMAMASSNFRNVSGYELEALFTWSRQMEPVEAGLIPTGELRFCISKRLRSQWDIQIDPSIWSFAFATWTVIHSKSPMIWRSCSFWRNTDLNGDFGSTTPANPLCSFRVPHSLSYYVYNATKLAPVWSCPDTLAGHKDHAAGFSILPWHLTNTKDSLISTVFDFVLWLLRRNWTTWLMTGLHFFYHYY